MAVSSFAQAFVCHIVRELADLDFSTVVADDVRQVLSLALAAIATLAGLQAVHKAAARFIREALFALA